MRASRTANKGRKAVIRTMGIRFRCPNGHKLNVKSFLAGKRGVCPDCGQTFRIPPDGTDDSGVVAMPLESRRNGSPRGEEDNLAESDFEAAVAVAAAAISEPTRAATEGVVFLPPMPARDAPAPQVRPPQSQPSQAAAPEALSPLALSPQEVAPQAREPQSPTPAIEIADSSAPDAPEIFFPVVAKSPTPPKPGFPRPAAPRPSAPSPPPPPAPADPIAEAPAAVWYVRPPSGGQYGPAKGDVMRKWIAEGRVSSDSLVWREDWSDWREAGPLFASLATPAAVSASPLPASTLSASTASKIPSIFPAKAGSLPAVVAGSSPRSITERKSAVRKRGNEMAVAALVCLVLVCVILVTVLVVVLSQGSA